MGKRDTLEEARKMGELVGRSIRLMESVIPKLEDHERRIKAIEKSLEILVCKSKGERDGNF
jgi:hypothetical protein